MKHRKLGRTDIDVSVMCLGTMTWGKQNTQDEGFAQRKNRDQVILASKIAGPQTRPWIRDGGPINKQSILEAIEGSLKRLQTDYIDLYQLHWPNRGSYAFQQHWGYAPDFDPTQEEANFIEVLQTLDACIQEGKIRHVGLSNESAWGTMKYLHLAQKHGLPRMVSVQNEYSLGADT